MQDKALSRILQQWSKLTCSLADQSAEKFWRESLKNVFALFELLKLNFWLHVQLNTQKALFMYQRKINRISLSITTTEMHITIRKFSVYSIKSENFNIYILIQYHNQVASCIENNLFCCCPRQSINPHKLTITFCALKTTKSRNVFHCHSYNIFFSVVEDVKTSSSITRIRRYFSDEEDKRQFINIYKYK